jgi:hypothetical protein
MLQWVSRLRRPRSHEPSVLSPGEIPHDQVNVVAKGRDGSLGDVTVVLTRKRLLLTNRTYTKETLSIPLVDVTALESTPRGIRLAYRDPDSVEQELWLGHIPTADKDDLVWMGDDSWVQSVAARILEETGRDVWRETETPWYRRDC